MREYTLFLLYSKDHTVDSQYRFQIYTVPLKDHTVEFVRMYFLF
jgi:hypothetical protein